jgi:hypothetical protein
MGVVSEPQYDGDLATKAYVDGLLRTINGEITTINGDITTRSQNFGSEPIPPYYINDTYMNGTDIYICTTQRLIGGYNSADWSKASAYTDDTLASTKNKVFTSTPTTPYRLGDLWAGGPNGELRRCVITRLTGTYNAADWENATVYDSTETVVEGGLVTTGTIQVVQGGTVAAGMTGNTSGDTSIRFWAGSTYANRETAPFRVTQAGAVTASNMNITGGTLSWSELNKPTKSDLGTWTTYINDTGIYTGTLTAGQVNAVAINASSITTGSMSAARITSGTMNAARISGGTISGIAININDVFQVFSSGGTRITSGSGYLSVGDASSHPWVSALNIASTGGGTQGISFRTTNSVGNVGSERGHISMNTSNAMFITSSGTININNDYGGNVGIKNLVVSGNNIGDGGGHVYINSRVVLVPASGDYAYVNSATSANRIQVNSGGPSSRNIKKNIKELNNQEYQNIYKDIQKLKTHTFQYKYKNIKEYNNDFGFIIDEIEELPTISKYTRNYDAKAYIRNNKFVHERQDDKKQQKYKSINYKEWDRDSYIKTLLLMIKSMQIKIDELEEKVKGGE